MPHACWLDELWSWWHFIRSSASQCPQNLSVCCCTKRTRQRTRRRTNRRTNQEKNQFSAIWFSGPLWGQLGGPSGPLLFARLVGPPSAQHMRNHPPPQHHAEKTIYSKFGAKIQICGAKIQILDPISINFCTTENLPLCKRKSPNPASLSPTHPLLGLSKKSKYIPLDVFSTFWFLNLGILYVEVIFKSIRRTPRGGSRFWK